MNSEEKIYSKIKNASHKGEKDFPGMDKVWNRVEEKLENTLVVKKKNTWQKLAIAATVLLSFSIIYQFVSNDEISKDKINNNTTNPVIVSHDSVKNIMDTAKEVVAENNNTKAPNNKVTDSYKSETPLMESTYFNLGTAPDVMIDDTVEKINIKASAFNNYNNSNLSNSAFNSANSNTDYLLRGRKFETNTTNYDWSTEKKAETQEPIMAAPIEKNKDLVVIDGVAMDKRYNADKELEKLSAEEISDTTYLPNPLYIINGIEYSEESLFGKNPTSPYAPLDKQKITATNILEPVNATKIYGKKGKNGIVIITTKDGKPAKN